MWGDIGGYGWWVVGIGMVHMLLFWGLIILGIVALVKWLSGTAVGAEKSGEKTPLDILKQRYARGELDQKEFEEKKRHLES